MLKKLRIEQFVIIDKLELELQPGLTILTGETGAGKSILLDATGLLLGENSDRGAIRQGQDQSILEADFELPPSHPAKAFLAEKGLVDAAQAQFTTRRVLKRVGEDDISLNGKKIDLPLLKEVGEFLVEIHGQFANQSLLAPENQLHLLDLSGGFPPEILANVADALRDVKRTAKELEEEKIFLTAHKREAPHIEKIVARFEKIGMKRGFIEEVEAEYARLRTARETSESFQAILSQLIAANGIVMGLASAENMIRNNPDLDAEKVEKLADHLKTALDNSRAAVTEMRRIAPEYEIDTGPLEHYAGILDVLDDISTQEEVPFENLTDFFEEMASKRDRLKNGRENIARMEDALIEAKNSYRHHAHILTEKRIEAGEKLSAAITAELAPLKLEKAQFEVKVEEKADMPWTRLGINKVTFTARMNPGMPFSPVAETASGGELARLILALKVVVQKVQTIPTLIFDEVDTGIGGAAAAAVGDRLAMLADTTQVLVITHSPQVASRGDQHLHVSKASEGEVTRSVVNSLPLESRINEISRMLAGDVTTEESNAAARSLINEARKTDQARRAKLAS
ncbi:MAG: DNA repair protein RecN [Micavibrio sp.]